MSDTGKQRRSRIELGYYRRPDAMSRWRGRLTLLACLVAGAWVVAAPTWDGRQVGGFRLFQQDRLASKGPVARPHAMWETKCEACHNPFIPINDSSWAPKLGPAPDDGGSGRCQTCHAGPAHHASERKEDVPSCAQCHRDHRGRDASLLAMDDSVCTSCHQDLTAHRQGPACANATAEHVTRFDANPAHHPAFTLPRDESSRIKFSHARHMARGIPLEEGGKPFTFEWLDQSDRTRYGWSSGHDGDAIQLRCDSCHRLDGAEDRLGSSRTAGAPMVARASGALMLPITYENDCRACHPLRFEPKDPKRQVRHGLQPREIIDELREFYAAQAVKDDPKLLQRFIPPRPMPNQPISPESQKAGQAADAMTLRAIKLLFGASIEGDVLKRLKLPLGRRGCVECHEVTPAGQPIQNLEAAGRLEIKQPLARSLWYESARFDHAAHRAVDCAACHKDAKESKDQSVSLLPNISQCVDCHAPSTTRDGKPVGGAGVSCVECHRYHNGDHPAQGTGARARLGKAEMAVDQFLNGGPPRGR